MAKYVHFPSEIIIEILVRLPPKPVGRFKIISKEWYGLISSPNFIKKHRAQMMKQNQVRVLLQAENHFTPFKYQPPADGAAFNRFSYQGLRDFDYLGSCNGIVLVCSRDDELYLLNPTNGNRTSVPSEPIDFPSNIQGATTIFGLGFSDRYDNYYILRISLFHTNVYCSEVKLFSRNSSQWINLGQHPHQKLMSSRGVYANGCLHWRIYKEHLSVFNFDEQQFSIISVPEYIQHTQLFYQLFSFNNDKLVLIKFLYSPTESIDVWIMHNYHFSDSWVRHPITLDVPIIDPAYINFQPLFLVEPKREKLVFRINPLGTFGIWDFIEQRFYYTFLQPIANVPAFVFPYIESLE